MPNHIFSVPCLRVIQDKYKKLDSLVDIIETATLPVGKKYIPHLKLYSKWIKTCATDKVDEFDVKISTVSPGNKKKKLNIFNADIPENVTGMTMILEFGSIKVDELGMWKILLEWKEQGQKRWKKAAELPIFLEEKRDQIDG